MTVPRLCHFGPTDMTMEEVQVKYLGGYDE
jgi:hypothetical protein